MRFWQTQSTVRLYYRARVSSALFLDIQIKDDTKKGLKLQSRFARVTLCQYCFLHDSFRVSSLNFSIPTGSSRLYWQVFEGEDFQKRLESIILLTCKRYRVRIQKTLFGLRMLRPLFRFPFMISCTLRPRISSTRLSFILKRSRLSFMAVSLKLKRVTLDCLNVISPS